MMGLRSILRDRRGATVVEFAVVAPLFLTMLFGVVEGGRMFYTKQALDEVAYATARCVSIDVQCGTAQQQRSFAVSRGLQYGVSVAPADVVLQPNVTCKGQPASNAVTVSAPFASPAAKLLPLPERLGASACFPVLS